MKEAYRVRIVDIHGRVALPKIFRTKLGIRYGDEIEFCIDNDMIVVRKYEKECIFCSSFKLDFGHSAFCVAQHISGSTSAMQGFAMCLSPRDIVKTLSAIHQRTESLSCWPGMAFAFGLPLAAGLRSKMAKVELRM